MAANTKIEWAHHTFNPWIGCTKVSEECRHCYAEAEAKRRGWAQWGVGQPRYLTKDGNWQKPLMWDKQARAAGIRQRVFCSSLADVFDNEVPNEWRARLFDLIAATPNLDWLLLTKRPDNAFSMFPDEFWPNVWLGTSVGAYKSKWRIHALRKLRHSVPVLFLSCEPLLERLGWLNLAGIDQVIVGGESGSSSRKMPLVALFELQKQCQDEDISFFFKQTGLVLAKELKLRDRKGGDWNELPIIFRVREFPKNSVYSAQIPATF